MKENRNALIFGFAIIIAAMLIGNAYKSKYDKNGYISVTGLGKEDFTSDLIVWEGRFIAVNKDLKAAYETLNQEKQIILDYLTDKGVAKENIVFNAVATQEKNKNKNAASWPRGREIHECAMCESDALGSPPSLVHPSSALWQRWVQRV